MGVRRLIIHAMKKMGRFKPTVLKRSEKMMKIDLRNTQVFRGVFVSGRTMKESS